MPATEDEAAVRENLDEWLAAFNAKDTDKLMSLYDPESLYANATAPLARGVGQIRPCYEAAFKAVTGTLLFREEKLIEEQNMALLIGKYYFAPAGEGEGDTGRVALVCRRSEGHCWRLLFDMDNTQPDVSPEDFR